MTVSGRTYSVHMSACLNWLLVRIALTHMTKIQQFRSLQSILQELASSYNTILLAPLVEYQEIHFSAT